ncbi:uncharacterized protein V1518DRAFT_421975 [Limtongia smithiae]|uniref:uncharacterized protein n=1 Tax=Limtongia smithiae TaxID=1125753 RepID=UPI0034CD8A6F
MDDDARARTLLRHSRVFAYSAVVLIALAGGAWALARARGAGANDGSNGITRALKDESITDEERSSSPEPSPADRARRLRAAGNTQYKVGNYIAAASLYTTALAIPLSTPDAAADAAVCLSNRSACHLALHEFHAAIADATAALEREPEYWKAMMRRGYAHEQIGEHDAAVVDYTATCILSTSRDNERLAAAVDRLLVLGAGARMREANKARTWELPSAAVVGAYVRSFHDEYADEDGELKEAFAELARGTYDAYTRAHALFDAATAKATTSSTKATALELRGALRALQGDRAAAVDDLTSAILLHPTATRYIRRALVHIERGDVLACQSDFDAAGIEDPCDPDMYYHRGQTYLLLGEFSDAAADYERAVELLPEFVQAHVQLALVLYKQGRMEDAVARFQDVIAEFSTCAEVYNYYGELLMYQQRLQEAVGMFETALAIARHTTNGAVDVTPLVNLALMSWQHGQGTLIQAEELLRCAVEADERSEIAVATLVQFLLARDRVEEAIPLARRQLTLARSEHEQLQAAKTLAEAETQMMLYERYPRIRERIRRLGMPEEK